MGWIDECVADGPKWHHHPHLSFQHPKGIKLVCTTNATAILWHHAATVRLGAAYVTTNSAPLVTHP